MSRVVFPPTGLRNVPFSVLRSDHHLLLTPNEAANQSPERRAERESPEPAELTRTDGPVAAMLPSLLLPLQL